MENLSKKEQSNQKDSYKKSIKKWYDKRETKSFLESYLSRAGNSFTFKFDRPISNYLHIYLALDDREVLNFYFIEENDDKLKNNKWISSSKLSSHKEPLPSKLKESYESKKLPYQEVVKWVDNWNDEKIRREWLDTNFNSKIENNTIPLAFKIDSSDFSVGAKHECFLALKKINSTYIADIVVYNNESGEILNLKEKVQVEDSTYEDLARPVPPFGDSYNDYGVLVELNIK